MQKINGGKTALVLGCKGQDGSLLCKSLINQGFEVVGLTRNRSTNLGNLKSLKIEQDINLEEGKITDYTLIKQIIESHNPIEIYNLAAQSSVGKSFSSPKETIESIIQGTINILEVSKDINYEGRLFFAGSSEIFGNTKIKADLNHKQNPQSPYGIAKQTSLNLVKMYREQYNLSCVTGILFNHESPFRQKDFVTQKIISEAILCSKNSNHKLNIGNIEIARDWGWAEEYVEGMQLITRAKKVKDQILCTGKLTSLKQFIEITFKKLNLSWEKHTKIDKSLFRSKDIKVSVGNPIQMEIDLNWKAKVGIDLLIEKLIESKIKL